MRKYNSNLHDKYRKSNQYFNKSRSMKNSASGKFGYRTQMKGFPTISDKDSKVYKSQKYRTKSRNPKKKKLIMVSRKRSSDQLIQDIKAST